eukprot:TRINITY_DN8645_c0_g2_i2.p1 TRINITY_DN8645_c0_g2~~TRINITY_DN8645_c0_g2_i2.p1  ORF type:complete len:273 (+),score=45.99 TRINITY_DN8645_c0_g2_i2:77-895(+)
MSWRVVVPNAVTLIGLATGISSIWFALEKDWRGAAGCIVLSAWFDGVDGLVARALKGTSQFGAELDSLADYVDFGVSPALVVYLWKLHELGSMGWFICLAYVLCIACRLARFNTGVDAQDEHSKKFFLGVPSPAGAGIVLTPMISSFVFPALTNTSENAFVRNLGQAIGRVVDSPYLVAGFFVFGAILAVSTIRTFSSKLILSKEGLSGKSKAYKAGLFGFLLCFFIWHVLQPWHCCIFMFCAYVSSMPVSMISYARGPSNSNKKKTKGAKH